MDPASKLDSPKRKRHEGNPMHPLQTCMLPRFIPDGQAGDASPRTQVAGRFQRLDLEHSGFCQSTDMYSPEVTDPSKPDDPEDTTPSPSPKKPKVQQSQHTPTPVIPLQPSHVSSSTASSSSEHTQDPSSLTPPPPTERPKSPSLSGEISDQYWHESEITGHDPDDPADDGYGINGIGFRPTPAIAWARSQKRKQQLADYRSREAREARAKRNETRRRRGGSGEFGQGGARDLDGEGGKVKVRFDDG